MRTARRLVRSLAACLLALCLMLILMISSIEVVCCHTPGYFRHEFEKYHVLLQLNRETDMDQLLTVSSEMMAYLRGRRADLSVYITMDGKKQDFFNAKEKAHMADVRGLFLAGLRIRRTALVLALILAALLWAGGRSRAGGSSWISGKPRISAKHWAGGRPRAREKSWAGGKSGAAPALSAPQRAGLITALICLALVLVIGFLASLLAPGSGQIFDRIFILFHETLFDNDLWLLDPVTDDLINILPEGFFADTALRIAGLYLIVGAAGCFIFYAAARRRALASSSDIPPAGQVPHA